MYIHIYGMYVHVYMIIMQRTLLEWALALAHMVEARHMHANGQRRCGNDKANDLR